MILDNNKPKTKWDYCKECGLCGPWAHPKSELCDLCYYAREKIEAEQQTKLGGWS